MWQPDCCRTSYMKNACRRETAAVRTCSPWGWRMAGGLKKKCGGGRFGTLVWMLFHFACLLQWVRSVWRARPCDSVGSPGSCPLTSGYYLIGVVTILASLMAQQVKESACKVGNLGSIPKLGRSPGGEQPTAIFLPGNLHGQKEPWGVQSVGSQRVRHDWNDWACMHDHFYLFAHLAGSLHAHPLSSSSGLGLNWININKSQENVALTSASCPIMLFSLLWPDAALLNLGTWHFELANSSPWTAVLCFEHCLTTALTSIGLPW